MKKLQILRSLLVIAIEQIDSGNCSLNEELIDEVTSIANKFVNPDKMNKYNACRYVKLKHSRFDDYVRMGLIPQGQPEAGSHELRWHKSDLDIFLSKHLTNKSQ